MNVVDEIGKSNPGDMVVTFILKQQDILPALFRDGNNRNWDDYRIQCLRSAYQLDWSIIGDQKELDVLDHTLVVLFPSIIDWIITTRFGTTVLPDILAHRRLGESIQYSRERTGRCFKGGYKTLATLNPVNFYAG